MTDPTNKSSLDRGSDKRPLTAATRCHEWALVLYTYPYELDHPMSSITLWPYELDHPMSSITLWPYELNNPMSSITL